MIAKMGSLKAASQKNYVTQPAVSQHLRLLEEKLGCKLFERRSNKIYLTSCGKVFLTAAQNILSQYEDARIQISEMNERSVYPLRLATTYSIGLYQLQPIVRSFLKRFPAVDVHLEYQPFDKIYDRVGRHEIDFGFVSNPKARHGIVCETFATETLVLVQSPAHRVIKHRSLALRDLNGVKFVAFAWNTPTRTAIDAFLRQRQCAPKIMNEYDNVETLKSAVTLGVGCSIVPEIAVRREVKDRVLEILPVRGLTLKRPLGILYAKKKALSRTPLHFLETVLKHR